MNKKHIIFYSSGIASYVAAKRVAEKYGTDNLILLFADTGIEDEDNYRFLYESAKNVGGELVIVKNGKTPWDIIKEQNFVNHRVAMCSMVLKKEPCKKYVEQFNPTDCCLYIGISYFEIERLDAIKKGWQPYKVEAPLCWNTWVEKHEMFDLCHKEGLRPPRLYDLGFAHANCGGFCFKAGKAQFKKLLENFPSRYEYHENQEIEFMAQNGSPRILREQTKNKTVSISLKDYRERLQSQLSLFDNDDWGGCGCFTKG